MLDSRLASPVGRITADTKGSRIYLHGFRTDAAKLLTFTREIIHLLPAWLEDDQLEINLDTSDADRASQTVQQSAPISKPDKLTPLQTPITSQISPPPPPHSEMVQIPSGQWKHAMHTIEHLTQRLATMEGRVEVMMTTLENTPTTAILRDTLDDAVSLLTQTITSSSASIKDHAAHASCEALTTVARNIDTNNENILKLCDVVNNSIASSATTITDALTKVSDMASIFTNSDTSTLPQNISHIAPAPSGALDDFTTGIAPTLNLESAASPLLPETSHTSGPRPDTDVPDSANPVLEQLDTPNSPGYESPDEDLTRPRTADCFGCNKIDDDIQQCDHCELPFHLNCLIASPPGGISHYCPDCIDKLLPSEPHSSSSHPTPLAEGSGLTESSGTSASDSDASEYAPKYKAVPMSNSTRTPTSQTRELRPRKKR